MTSPNRGTVLETFEDLESIEKPSYHQQTGGSADPSQEFHLVTRQGLPAPTDTHANLSTGPHHSVLDSGQH